MTPGGSRTWSALPSEPSDTPGVPGSHDGRGAPRAHLDRSRRGVRQAHGQGNAHRRRTCSGAPRRGHGDQRPARGASPAQSLLAGAGHDVDIVLDEGLAGAADHAVLAPAVPKRSQPPPRRAVVLSHHWLVAGGSPSTRTRPSTPLSGNSRPEGGRQRARTKPISLSRRATSGCHLGTWTWRQPLESSAPWS